MQKVFYSPGPYCNTDTYVVVDFDGVPSEADLAQTGQDMAYDHYESYADDEFWNGDIEPEFDYYWYDIDDPEVQGRF